MKALILGGGLAGISLAYFLRDREEISSIDIIEKEDEPGGLCRSFFHDGIAADIGPHIFFSKDKETLGFMLEILEGNSTRLRRSNRIIHKNSLVQYPFENDLSKLPAEDRRFCVNSFINNPYKDYSAENMLQFFLKTFGEGIANLYLRPYNEKIWKFDPSFMDVQMVERIPRPSDDDIFRSAAGETVDGYLHQLYFNYPKKGGTAAFISAFIKKLGKKTTVHTSHEVLKVEKRGRAWRVKTGGKDFDGDLLISCMPVDRLIKAYDGIDEKIKTAGGELKYNNIMVAAATVTEDRSGDNFAFMCAAADIIFHRISKLDFLDSGSKKRGSATYLMEYTYRDGDPTALSDEDILKQKFIGGLKKIGFISDSSEVMSFTLIRFPYAYVIYDLNHKKNMKAIRNYFKSQNVYLNGRFGNFEYWNMDRVISESKRLSGEDFNA